MIATDDPYKTEAQLQWDRDPCGSHYVKNAPRGTLDWFMEVEDYRYGTFAPWMPGLMEFARHRGERVLEVGGGIGTDHAQFARYGAITTDIDLSSGHLDLARQNFALRGLKGEFRHGDAEAMPFEDGTFDLVYSNGVIHHTPNTRQVVREMHRVLKPGGRAIVMVYAENSLHYWRRLFYEIGIAKGELDSVSMGDIMSRSVELSTHGSKPLVKVYTRRRLRALFEDFADIKLYQRQLVREELPRSLSWLSVELASRLFGWNLVIKARKPVAR